jgi:hypothetical protein
MGVLRRRARNHQAARTGDPFLDRVDDRGVDRVVHPEVIEVDDEYPGIGRKTQQLTRPNRGRGGHGLQGVSLHVFSIRTPSITPAAVVADCTRMSAVQAAGRAGRG